jgi:hypothetical protein
VCCELRRPIVCEEIIVLAASLNEHSVFLCSIDGPTLFLLALTDNVLDLPKNDGVLLSNNVGPWALRDQTGLSRGMGDVTGASRGLGCTNLVEALTIKERPSFTTLNAICKTHWSHNSVDGQNAELYANSQNGYGLVSVSGCG